MCQFVFFGASLMYSTNWLDLMSSRATLSVMKLGICLLIMVLAYVLLSFPPTWLSYTSHTPPFLPILYLPLNLFSPPTWLSYTSHPPFSLSYTFPSISFPLLQCSPNPHTPLSPYLIPFPSVSFLLLQCTLSLSPNCLVPLPVSCINSLTPSLFILL